MPGPEAARILFLDVDGVLTDGTLWVAQDGGELKRFCIADGAGIKAVADLGLSIAVISGHDSETTMHRFRRLGVADIELGVTTKLEAFRRITERYGLAPEEAAVMGDDLVDLPMMEAAGFKATVPGAHPEVLEAADYVTTRPAGRGAVREVIEVITRAQGTYDELRRRMMG